jgi:D-threo-aldose 1-dehydrogenase
VTAAQIAARAALGWANLGGYACAQPPTHSDQQAVFERACQLGVRMHDTAIDYGRGFAELGLGLAWTELGIPRSELRIQSKVLRKIVLPTSSQEYREAELWNCPEPYARYITTWDWSYDGVWKQAEESRSRLRIDYHNGLALHDPMEAMAEAGLRLADLGSSALAALRDLKDKGLLREIGVGTKDITILPELVRLYPGVFDYFMIMNYNLLDHARCLDELIPLCQDQSIALFLAGPYASGILASPLDQVNATFYYRPAPPAMVRKVECLVRLAREFGFTSLKPVAVQFVGANNAFSKIVFGGRTAAEIKENVSYLRDPLPFEFWRRLRDEECDDRPLIHPRAPLFEWEETAKD